MNPFNRILEGNGCATDPEPVPSLNGSNGAPIPEAPPAAGDGRDSRGRFAAGNRGGPGNPFARQTAAFRRALCATITEEDLVVVAQQLRDKARAGDLAAIKLFLAYVVGRPVATVDPDTLDLEEWRQWCAEPDDPREVTRVVMSPGTEALCAVARAVRPTMTQTFHRGMLGGLHEQEERDARRAARKKKRRARRRQPSANGDNGAARAAPPAANSANDTPPPPPPPIANGANGAPAGGAAAHVGPRGLLKLMGAMLDRAFRAQPPDGTPG